MARTRQLQQRQQNEAPPPPADDGDDNDDLLPSDPEESDPSDPEESDPEGSDDENENEPEPILEANIRASIIAMYKRVLSFSDGAATALYDVQHIVDLDTLRELDDESVKEIGRSFAKGGHPISILSQNRLRLLVFWAKHRWRTCRGVDDLADVDYDQDVRPLLDQKRLEDDLDPSSEPEPPTMTLTPTTAAACFTNMKNYLARCRGRLGIPLDYVVRAQLKGLLDASEDGPEDPPPFGDPDSPYETIDAELTARAAILRPDLTHQQLAQPLDVLEAKGPFNAIFIQDAQKVFELLQAVWGTSQSWTHARAAAGRTKNGRKAYRTLHAQLLGGQQLIASGAAIMNKLQALRFDGEKRGFTFDKYVALHVQGHVEHDDLQQYGVKPLTDELKIHWFQSGITDKSFDAVRASINADPTKFTTFPAVQEAYVTFRLQQRQNDPTPCGRQVASVRAGARRNDTSRARRGRGRGGGDRKKGIFSAEELAACKVVDRDYSNDEYWALTDLQRQKLYMIRNPDKPLGTGPTRQSRRGGRRRNDTASVASTNTSGTKRSNEDPGNDSREGDHDPPEYGRNRNNPAVMGRQSASKTQKTDADK